MSQIFNKKHHRGLVLSDAEGFTLIEILVVIVIIASVSVIGIFIIGAKIKQARDARRRSDLSEIRVGLEQYYSEQSVYPANLAFNDQPLTGPAGQIYLPRVHHDPINTGSYLYAYLATPSASPQSYSLCAQLESQAEPFCLSNVPQ